MTPNQDIQITSFDFDDLKQRLIEYVSSKPKFQDFNYEGSTINMIIDLLTRDTTYNAFLANMLANESFIKHAKIRQNVVAHAEKLGYVPRSTSAARLSCNLVVTPAVGTSPPPSIIMDAGSVFLANVAGQTYSFVSIEDYTLYYNSTTGKYTNIDPVVLYQGQRIRNTFVHIANQDIVIPNDNCDTSTMVVTVAPSDAINEKVVYTKADSIVQLNSSQNVYFLGEDDELRPYIEFGRNILGNEPATNSIVEITYVATEKNHANGVKSLIAATTIGGNSNIVVTVTEPSRGGSEREDIESIRFLAPKSYQRQGRAVTADDYVNLIKENFPFVKSAYGWGGQDNDPPMYGNVLISILPVDGSVITEGAKQDIVTFLEEYNVASVTPIIVTPEIFYLDLTIKFDYNPRITEDSFAALSTKLVNVARSYDESYIGDFKKIYNESKLVDLLMNVRGVTTVTIDKKVKKDVRVLRFSGALYEIEFNNPIRPNSVYLTGFSVSNLATSQTLSDNGRGQMILTYNIDGVETSSVVGYVDYDRGGVGFAIDMIQQESTVRLYAEPTNDNFFVRTQEIVSFDSVTTSLVDKRITV